MFGRLWNWLDMGVRLFDPIDNWESAHETWLERMRNETRDLGSDADLVLEKPLSAQSAALFRLVMQDLQDLIPALQDAGYGEGFDLGVESRAHTLLTRLIGDAALAGVRFRKTVTADSADATAAE